MEKANEDFDTEQLSVLIGNRVKELFDFIIRMDNRNIQIRDFLGKQLAEAQEKADNMSILAKETHDQLVCMEKKLEKIRGWFKGGAHDKAATFSEIEEILNNDNQNEKTADK